MFLFMFKLSAWKMHISLQAGKLGGARRSKLLALILTKPNLLRNVIHLMELKISFVNTLVLLTVNSKHSIRKLSVFHSEKNL